MTGGYNPPFPLRPKDLLLLPYILPFIKPFFFNLAGPFNVSYYNNFAHIFAERTHSVMLLVLPLS